jgi:hypothetical protein
VGDPEATRVIDTLIPTRLQLTRGSTTYDLYDGVVLFETTDGPVTLYYLDDNGLGMPPIVNLSERGPAQHGDTDRGYHYDSRIYSYIFGIHAPNTHTNAHLYSARDIVLRMFKRSTAIAIFKYTLANGEVRWINGHFNGGMMFANADRQEGTWFQRFAVDFKANDPFFYDPTIVTHTLDNEYWNGAVDGFDVPLPVPFDVGPSLFIHEAGITYTGSFDSYPTIRINGPITDPVIQHMQLGLTIPLNGSVGAGEYWDIILDTARKQIKDATGASVMRVLDDPNDIDVFRIASDPDVPEGGNSITITGRNADSTTTVVISYYTRYLGI